VPLLTSSYSSTQSGRNAEASDTSTIDDRFHHSDFPSMVSIAANFRSTCGSERGAPECSTQGSPAATPHVGHGTEDNCSGVSSFFFIWTECHNTHPRNRSVLNLVRTSRYPIGRAFSRPCGLGSWKISRLFLGHQRTLINSE